MTTSELNAMPHGTKAELDAIPSINLKFTVGATVPDYLKASVTRVFDAIETSEGWDGCQRTPRTGDFGQRQLFPRSTYELA
jgi:hypothetical protein